MEVLQKEPLSSDSEDEDYIPPDVKAPTLSLRKRSGGLELESDDDDDDDDDDLSDDADLVDAEAAQLYTSLDGAGPSSAGAGPSNARAGPSSTGAGSSGLGAGAGSSAIGSLAAAGSIHTGASSTEADAIVGAGSSTVADGSKAGGSAAGSNAAVGSSAAAGAMATIPPVKATGTDVNGAQSANVEEPITKKPRVETVEENKSIDDIWADMNAGVMRTKAPTTTPDAGLAAWLEPSPPPKKEFKVTRLSDLEKAVQHEEPMTKEKGRTGLEGVLDVVRGKSEKVIEKTKKQWKEFKKDEDVNDELEKYKKDKDRYTDKVAFLQRTDVREWEYEQKGKRRR